MARKRKHETKSDPEIEPPKEPTPEVEEPMDEPLEEAQEAEAQEGEAQEEEAHIEAEAPSEDDQKPQALENIEPIAAPSDTPADPSTSIVAVGDAATSNGKHEDDGDNNDPASIHKLLEPFPKDQLVELLRDAAINHQDVLQKIHQIADQDPALRKIFVHGLGWDTNAESLTSFFSQYGEIEDCNAVTDKITGKSKGYAFILFKHRSGARRALKEPQKKIGNRMTACQLASAGPVPPPPPPVSEYTQRKIFISNVAADVDPHKLLQFFSKYGEIEEGPLGLDKVTGKPKGFALFVYKSIESAKKALEEPHKNFEGHILHCQRAIDGPKQNKPGFHLQHHGVHKGSGGVGVHGSHFPRNENSGFMGGGNHVPQTGHLMAPSASGLGFNQAAAPAAAAGLNPALGQALTALLATQGAGLGLGNLLSTLGSAGMGGGMINQGVGAPMGNSGVHGMQGGYGNQAGGVGGNMNPAAMGGYGAAAPMQGGYGNSAMGQGSTGRGQQGGGHMGGGAPYMGR